MKTPEEKKADSAAYYAANKEKLKAYRAANSEKKKAYDAAYCVANKEKLRAYRAANAGRRKALRTAYRKANTEEVRAADRAYHAANREKINTASRAHRAANPEKARTYGRAWKRANREKIAAQVRIRKYGMSPECFQLMLLLQRNACGICKEVFSKEPCVDHCHKTGEVRGLLCHPCNRGLGGFRDTIAFLKSAEEYLQG